MFCFLVLVSSSTLPDFSILPTNTSWFSIPGSPGSPGNLVIWSLTILPTLLPSCYQDKLLPRGPLLAERRVHLPIFKIAWAISPSLSFNAFRAVSRSTPVWSMTSFKSSSLISSCSFFSFSATLGLPAIS